MTNKIRPKKKRKKKLYNLLFGITILDFWRKIKKQNLIILNLVEIFPTIYFYSTKKCGFQF